MKLPGTELLDSSWPRLSRKSRCRMASAESPQLTRLVCCNSYISEATAAHSERHHWLRSLLLMLLTAVATAAVAAAVAAQQCASQGRVRLRKDDDCSCELEHEFYELHTQCAASLTSKPTFDAVNSSSNGIISSSRSRNTALHIQSLQAAHSANYIYCDSPTFSS
jgi:hypothetical protein